MAREWMRFVVPLVGRTAKCLVIDLDNTLWGGVIGETAWRNQVVPNIPRGLSGAATRAARSFAQGILLAACTRTSRRRMEASTSIRDARALPELRRVAHQLDRQIRTFADRPGTKIGLDSLAFLDDNPFEREQVRAGCPKSRHRSLAESARLRAIVRDCPVFERLTLSAKINSAPPCTPAAPACGAEQSFQSKETSSLPRAGSRTESRIGPLRSRASPNSRKKTNQFN